MLFEEYQTFVVQESAQKSGPIAPTIVQSAAFGYASAEEAEGIFCGEVRKPLYARVGNPTTAMLERLVAKIDDAAGCVSAATGMGAIAMVATAMLEAGDEVACVGGLFGGSYTLFSQTLSRFGIKVKFVRDADEVRIGSRTKMLFCESVGNPNLKIVDFDKLAAIAKEHGLLFVVDNTLTPLLFNPLAHGADMAVYSTTKILAGFAQALGGAVNFRALNENDRLFDTFTFLKKFYERLGSEAFMGVLKKRALRDVGMSQKAHDAYLTILGLQTLAWRIERVSESALKVTSALEGKLPVRHPKNETLYERYFPHGSGQMITLEFKSKQEAFDFLNRSELAFITANIGDARTLALHMASTIYRDFSRNEREFLGVSDGLVRVSVGLEDPEAIVNDFLRSYG
jgi:O-acetylhomoserine (thiol)-lyase